MIKNIKTLLREALLNENNKMVLFHGSKTKINDKKGFSTDFIKSGHGENIFGWGYILLVIKNWL